jgi:hypothetical protein
LQRLHSKPGLRPRNNAEKSKALLDAVETLHGVRARFVGAVAVREQFRGKTVWKGLISRFELQGHPAADLCYAWSVPAANDSRPRFHAVLHTHEVNSAKKAVRAAFVADLRNSLSCEGANDAEYPCGQSRKRLSASINDAQLVTMRRSDVRTVSPTNESAQIAQILGLTPIDAALRSARDARRICSPEELCRLINEELAQFVACSRCRVTAVDKLPEPRQDGCNWDSHVVGMRQEFEGSCLPVFARTIRDFQDKYNLA